MPIHQVCRVMFWNSPSNPASSRRNKLDKRRLEGVASEWLRRVEVVTKRTSCYKMVRDFLGGRPQVDKRHAERMFGW